MQDRSKILAILHDEIELEGYEPGSPQHERIFLARRVQKCQEFQGVSECQSCPAFLDCVYAAEYLRMKAAGIQASEPKDKNE